MNNKRKILSVLILSLILGCQSERPNRGEGEHAESGQVEQLKGVHGGKLFEKDGFAVEVTIYEPEIPPQSRVYVYENGKPIDPSLVTLVTELHRIDRVDTIHYSKQDDYLQGDIIVEEPHSFDVKLVATYQGKSFSWEYPSYEGRTTLSNAAIKSSGIELEKAKDALIKSSLKLNGRVETDKLKAATLTARYPGVVKEVRKVSGSKVEKGDVIATIESNESLRIYDLTAPRAGEVLELNAAVGEGVVNSAPIATVGDLTSVWVDLTVPKSEFPKLRIGQKVFITSDDKDTSEKLEGKVIFLSSLADRDSQTRFARVEVANPNRILIPGLFVEASIVIDERTVPVAIKAEGLQKFRDWDVVFKKVGQNFEIAILELGEVDGDWIEVKEGLSAGTEYVSKNSFVVKADVMKGGATHDH